VEKPVSENVHLREEHVVVERHAVDRILRPEEATFKNEDFEMTEIAEEVVIGKQARVVEEVTLHKCVEDRTEAVNTTLRGTEIDVTPISGFDNTEYRRLFDEQKMGGTFEDQLPAYELGHELRRSGAWSSERWEDVEGNARSRWEERNPGTWEKFKNSIRLAWSRAKS